MNYFATYRQSTCYIFQINVIFFKCCWCMILNRYLFHSSLNIYILGLILIDFVLQIMSILLTYLIYRSWTYIVYIIRSIKRSTFPCRLRDFAYDVYPVYSNADHDVTWCCTQLCHVLRQYQKNMRILLADEVWTGADKADSIVRNIQSAWKVGRFCTVIIFL